MDKILTPLQQALLTTLFSDEWFRRYFYLTGGTALSAFHLFHRYSEDLDLFCHGVELKPFSQLIRRAGRELHQPVKAIQTTPGFLRFTVGGTLQVDAVTDTEFRVGIPEWIDAIRVDNVKNIAVNKVCAMLGRLDAKDYVDLFFLLKEKELDIFELLTLGQEKDGGLDAFVWASLLVDVQTFTLLPRMIKPIALKELQQFFLKLRDQILDHLNPQL